MAHGKMAELDNKDCKYENGRCSGCKRMISSEMRRQIAGVSESVREEQSTQRENAMTRINGDFYIMVIPLEEYLRTSSRYM